MQCGCSSPESLHEVIRKSALKNCRSAVETMVEATVDAKLFVAVEKGLSRGEGRDGGA